jgi:hypothetical protein
VIDTFPILEDLEGDLRTAREDIADLEVDKATLIALADGHELHFERLREANAPMSERVEIRAQLTATRELILEQDEAIRDARARAQRLEAQTKREATVTQLLELTQEMTSTQEAFESDLAVLEVDLNERLERIYPHIPAWRAQRATFTQLIGSLGIKQYPLDAHSGLHLEHHVKLDALLSEIAARGVDPTPLTTTNFAVSDWRELYRGVTRSMPPTTAARAFTVWAHAKEQQLSDLARQQHEQQQAVLNAEVRTEQRVINGFVLELPVQETGKV